LTESIIDVKSELGFAFDDFTSYDHAWELSEIEANCIFDGRGFFNSSRR
jgi:hypothetical protein